MAKTTMPTHRGEVAVPGVFQNADLMAVYLDAKGGGDVGDDIGTREVEYLPREPQGKTVPLSARGARAAAVVLPRRQRPAFLRDEEKNLPEGCYSYVVHEFPHWQDCRITYDDGEERRLHHKRSAADADQTLAGHGKTLWYFVARRARSRHIEKPAAAVRRQRAVLARSTVWSRNRGRQRVPYACT